MNACEKALTNPVHLNVRGWPDGLAEDVQKCTLAIESTT